MSKRDVFEFEDEEEQRQTQPQHDVDMPSEQQREDDTGKPSAVQQMAKGKGKAKRKSSLTAATDQQRLKEKRVDMAASFSRGSQSPNLFHSQSPLRSPIVESSIVDLPDDSEEETDESDRIHDRTFPASKGDRGSLTWEYFGKNVRTNYSGAEEVKIVTAICEANNCNWRKQIIDGSTRNMRNHLKSHHRALFTELIQKELDKENAKAAALAKSTASPNQAQEKEKMRQQSIPYWKAANQVNTASKWVQGEARYANATRAILDYIVHSNKPLSTIDDPRFWKLICHFQPNYKIPPREKFRDMIPGQVEVMKTYLRDCLLQAKYVSFTTDIWTSKNNKASHISVTCHWITTDWQRRDFVLACTPFPGKITGKITGEAIAQKLNEAFSEWGLNPPADADAEISSTPARAIDLSSTGSDVQSSISPPQSQPQLPVKHTIVQDGCANMREGCDQINDTKNVQCVIHLLQLVVKEAVLEDTKMIKPVIKKCRAICQYVHQSARATAEFRKQQENFDPDISNPTKAKQLIGDVATRWTSTYIMLERILELREILTHFLGDEAMNASSAWKRENNLTPNDWLIVRTTVTQLKPFFKYTEIMSANKVSIGMTIFIIQCIKGEVESNHPDGDLLPLKPELLKHLEMRFFGGDVASRKVWYNILTDPRFTIPCLLHPLMKTKVFKKKSQRIQARSAVPVTYWHVLITLYFIKSVLILVEI